MNQITKCKIKNNSQDDNNPNKYYSKDTKGKILIMRHGETYFNNEQNKEDRKTNPNFIDCKLTPKGIEQAKSMKDILNNLKIEIVYISPMYRTFQTAFYILENHPNKSNIKVVIHPLINEATSCVQDYQLDIKKTKAEFNMNSKIKFDWSIFDDFVKNIKYQENFYYFDNFDCFEENKKNEMYQKLKYYYEKNDLNSLKKGLSDLSRMRYEQNKRFESLKHLQIRCNKFLEYIKTKHKDTLDNKENKILVIAHTSFIKIATDRTIYESEDIQNYHPNSYSCNNCEIISIKL